MWMNQGANTADQPLPVLLRRGSEAREQIPNTGHHFSAIQGWAETSMEASRVVRRMIDRASNKRLNATVCPWLWASRSRQLPMLAHLEVAMFRIDAFWNCCRRRTTLRHRA